MKSPLIPNTVPHMYAVDPENGLCYPIAAWDAEQLTPYAVGDVGLFEVDAELYRIRFLPEVLPGDIAVAGPIQAAR